MEPKVLLLDEPLSNLDAKLRVATRLEIRHLQQRTGITSVYVTHDQEEAMTLSDRVVIMHSGRIQQIGTPREIYARPVNRFVADFIGQANFLEGRYLGTETAAEAAVEVFGRRFRVPVPGKLPEEGGDVLLVVRPESIGLRTPEPEALRGRVRESVYLGNQISYKVEVEGQLLSVEVANPQEHRLYEAEEEVALDFHSESLHILPKEEG
jgi:iron(III) transport system ATP-binding protein